MHVTDVTWDETEPGFADSVDVAVQMGEHTPNLENPPPGAFYGAHGFLSYVAGQPAEKAIIPKRPPLTICSRNDGNSAASERKTERPSFLRT